MKNRTEEFNLNENIKERYIREYFTPVKYIIKSEKRKIENKRKRKERRRNIDNMLELMKIIQIGFFNESRDVKDFITMVKKEIFVREKEIEKL